MPPEDLREEKQEKLTDEPELEIVELDERGEPLDPKQAALLEAPGDEGEEDEERTALADDDDPNGRKERRAEQKRIRDAAKLRDQQTISLITRQNEELARRLAMLEGRSAAVDLATLDERIQAAKTQFQNATAHIADALEKKDTPRYMRALDARDQARDVHRDLVGIKRQELGRREAFNNGGEREAAPDPAVVSRIDAFKAKFSWWNGPDATDPDSNVVNTLDNGVARAGHAPNTDAYWSELERQMKQYLPHRFKAQARNGADTGAQSANGEQRQRRSPPTAGNGSEGSGARPGYVKITPQRKAAMIEAGSWDDPAKRKRQLKQYDAYDKAHPNERPA